VTAARRQPRKRSTLTSTTATKATAKRTAAPVKKATASKSTGSKPPKSQAGKQAPSEQGPAKQSRKRTSAKAEPSKTATARTGRGKAAPAATDKPPRPAGYVSFVGTGPGDPSLLTLRAVDLIRGADVVVTEAPEHEALLAEVCPDFAGTVVDGGYGEDGQPLTHASRAKLVVRHAKHAEHVVRLMSGDPWLYATGPEEALACVKAGVAFDVVPGVSAVTGVAAYAGVPLTTRTEREFSVVNVAESKVDWDRYGGDQTLVLLGAVDSIADIARSLTAAGRPGETPVAMTRVGTTTDQSTVISTLDTVAADAKAAKMRPPAVTVVGEVVNLRETLSWFETKPLFGWRVLVPRTKEQAASLSVQLRDYGAVPEEVPTISVEPPRNPQQMDKAVRGLVEGRYEWIAFTSVNAVRAVREKFDEYGLDARAFSGLKIAAVGDKTAEAIAAWGIRADLTPSGEQSARGLLEDWPPYDDVLDPINRVFLPRADIATETLVAGLVDLGWEVDDVTAYRTVRAAPPPAPTREAIKSGKFDAVVFTSSSTVRNLVGIAGKPHTSTVIACIGPATAKTAEEHGLRVDVLSPSPSIEELTSALAEFGAARRLAMIEAGEPVTKPSQRRPSARRRAT
jgi:uroporphyrinogen III methyltransferase / synthase